MTERPPDPSDRPDEKRRRRLRIAAIGAVLPLVAASLMIWSASGRQSHLDRVPVAIVNNDTIITDPQPMAAGRSLTAALTHPKTPSKNLKWVLTDQHDATRGLKDGTFYAVLTIPSDFSSSVLSTGTDHPVQGKLSLVSNSAASSTIPYVSQLVASVAATSLGTQVTQGYLGNVYDGFNTLAQSNQKAADSASQLAGGTKQLSAGAVQLDQGAGSLATSLDQVASGSAQLADGTASLHSGAVQVEAGVASLSQGTKKLHAGQSALAAGTRTLARQSAVLAGRSHELSAGSRGVAAGTRGVAAGTRLLSGEVRALSTGCAAAGGSPAFCEALSRASDHTTALAEASGRVGTAAGGLADGASRLAAGSGQLARGNGKVAAQSRVLNDASGQLSTSSAKLVGGATQVAHAADGVDGAAGKLADGTGSTAKAGGSLASGSRTLASSAGQTDDGAQQLSTGLANGAKQSPTYTDDQQKALKPVVSQPITLTNQVQHSSHGNGWLIAVIVAVVLWLAALVAALSRDLSGVLGHALAPVASRRLAGALALPVLGYALLQAVAVVAALVLFHRSMASFLPLALLVLVASSTFALLALGMRLMGGRAGVTLFVLLLVVQLAASGNVIPLETAPAVLRLLNGVLPMTVFVNGASQLVTGGHVASWVSVVLVLLVWAALSAALLVSAIKRHRLRDGVTAARVVLGPVRLETPQP